MIPVSRTQQTWVCTQEEEEEEVQEDESCGMPIL